MKIELKIFLIVVLEISNKQTRPNSTLTHFDTRLFRQSGENSRVNRKSNEGIVKLSLSVFSLKFHVLLVQYFNYMASNVAF